MSNTFLDSLDVLFTLSAVFLLCVNLLTVKKINSVFIATLAFIFVQGISFAFVELVRDSADKLSVISVRMIWYFGFAFANLVAVMVIYKLHRAVSEIYSIAANSTAAILMFFGILQVVSFFDRQYGYDFLATIYGWLIPIGNMAIVTLLAVSTVMLIMRKNGYSGIKGI